MLPWLTASLAAAAYLATAALLVIRLVRRTASPLATDWMRGAALATGLTGTLFHLLSLYLLIPHTDGLNLSLANVLSFTGWVIALVILVAALRQRVFNLAVLLLPIAAITTLHAAGSQEMVTLLEEPGPILVTHVVLSITAYSILSVAMLLALVLGFQERRLRRRHPGGILRILPPLELTEQLLFQLITYGFVGLTLALFSGLFFVEDLMAQHLVHKTVLSISAWVLFGVLLWGRHQFGWRGRVAIRWTLSAFVLLVLAYFGSRIILEMILGRTWG